MRPPFGGDPGFGEIKRCRVGRASQREQDFPGGDGNGLAVMLKGNRLQFLFAPCFNQPRAGEDLNAFAPEHLFHFNTGVRVKLAQHVPTALDERDLDAEPREQLGEFAGNRPAAKHDERFRQPLERQRIVTGDEANVVQLRQRCR